MKVVSTEALTKLIQLVKSAFISVDDTVETSEVELLDIVASKDLSNITQATKSDVTGWAFPDSAFTNLTLGASGTTYTASDDGWFHIAKRGTAVNQYLIASVGSSGLCDGGNCYGNAVEIDILIPVRKGQVLTVTYTLAGTTERFRFCKAYGVA